MSNKPLLKGAAFLFVALLIALLATLTLEEDDPCANPQQDISGAVLADQPGEQDALTNRAMIQRANCERQGNTKPTGKESGAVQLRLFPAAVAAQSSSPQPATQAPMQILEQRCMVCHGCYDAPCQLKLEAHEGLLRGASKELVYNGARLRQANLSRLFDDAQSEQAWRDKGFYPVLSEEDPGAGVMYRMLQLKQAHPLPSEGPLPESFDFSLYRDQQCPSEDEFDTYARDYPLAGMPYGFPGLSSGEHETLEAWLAKGAPAPDLPPISTGEAQLLAAWESFLNGKDKRRQLVARYIYEHLFLASLYLEDKDQLTWFRLVRSATPPGEPLQLIATRRPYDDPGMEQIYYRLQRMPVTPLAKIHMPYRFDSTRIDRYKELFLDVDYEVTELPGYAPEVSSNPFKVFVQIPVQSRYRFLLDEARFSIMNFIKGPVCRGQIALNVIEDHFWVMFVRPNDLDPGNNGAFLAREMDNLRLPTPRTGSVIDILSWRSYAKSNEAYQRARSRYIRSQVAADKTLGYDNIWTGDGSNDNAALTIFRHFDTASVERGWIGDIPKTAWVIDYSLLERIHYLLVAGFDVYGAAAHQLESRLYMDFLRMEGEFNFLMFLPADIRLDLHDYWYRGASKRSRDHFLKRSAMVEHTSGIDFSTDNPKREFLETLRDKIYGAQALQWDIHNASASPETLAALARMSANVGAHNSFLPQSSFVNVVGDERDEFYSLLMSAGHSNISQMFKEDERRLPEEDKLTVVRGFLGAYPNYFFQVNEKEVGQFADDVGKLASPKDFAALREKYGVRRNVPWFWRLSDKIHARYLQQDPIEYGLFDYNRYRGD
jgi:Fatty acid cis/trans isomerase (CTI)